jgi:hypothetical protein
MAEEGTMFDREVASIARRQRALITSDQLHELGMTEHEIRRRVLDGSLERIHQSVFAIPGAPRTWEQAGEAALLALPGSALGVLSSGRVHRFWSMTRCNDLTVLSNVRSHHDLPGVTVRRVTLLPPEHVEIVRGLRVTTRPRTLIDLATVLNDRRLQRVIEEELAKKSVSWDALARTFRSLAGRGRPGIARARRVIEAIEGKPPTESVLERMYLDLLGRAGVDLPLTQVTVPWADRQPGRVDCMFVDSKAIIELDGRTFHVRSDSFEDDRKRDQLATMHGFLHDRFTYRQIRDDPDHVVAVTRVLAGPRFA